ncbi:hypothetical protein MHYP_G00122140 [Metynnis hypsauchen]
MSSRAVIPDLSSSPSSTESLAQSPSYLPNFLITLSLLSLLITAHSLHPGLWLDSVFADSQAAEVFHSVCAGVQGVCVCTPHCLLVLMMA